jgi:hypothetical protein
MGRYPCTRASYLGTVQAYAPDFQEPSPET